MDDDDDYDDIPDEDLMLAFDQTQELTHSSTQSHRLPRPNAAPSLDVRPAANISVRRSIVSYMRAL
jgi:hypothetical protein